MPDEPAGVDPVAVPSPGDAQPGWIRVVLIVAVVVAFVLVVARFVKKDVVNDWKVLASCSTVTDVGADRLSLTLDMSACLTEPTDPGVPRGWPIVTFVLPPEVGPDPTITGVRSDDSQRTMSIAYEGAARPEGTQTGGHVLVFVEVPPGEVPTVPFTVIDTAGSTSVTAVP